MTYAEWILLTPAQQQAIPRALITNAPGISDQFVSKSGDTMSGNLTIDRSGTYSSLVLGGTTNTENGVVAMYSTTDKYVLLQPVVGVTDNRDIRLPDKSGTVMVDQGYISVTADGVKSYGQLLNELYALMDISKITIRSIYYDGSSILPIGRKATNDIRYFATYVEIDKVLSYDVIFKSNDSAIYMSISSGSTTTITNYTNNIPTSGSKFYIYY